MHKRDTTKRGGAKAGRRWKPALAAIDFDGRRRVFMGREAELISVMLEKGSASAQDFPAGTRLASTVFNLRTEKLIPVETARFSTTRGDATYASYSLPASIKLVSFRPGEWETDEPDAA